jgi:hypothetical protein
MDFAVVSSGFLVSDARTYPCRVAGRGGKRRRNSNEQRPQSCASKSNGRASPFYSDKGRGCGSGAVRVTVAPSIRGPAGASRRYVSRSSSSSAY